MKTIQSYATWLVGLSVAVLAAVAIEAAAQPSLTVDETDDHYAIVASDPDATPAKAFWEVKVDKTSGCLYGFKDLTDVGDGAGGHADYLGTNEGYGRKCGLLVFYGRGGQVLSRSLSVGGLAEHLAFVLAPDNSSFTITYAEDEASTAFFQSAYSSGDISLTPGDLRTSITVVIRPPTSAGTSWDWSIVQRNISEHGIDPRAWAKQEVRTYIDSAIPKLFDSEASDLNGLWDDLAPVSFGRYAVDANAAGLTVGRRFAIDYRYDMVDTAAGNSASVAAWAGFDYIRYVSPYNLSSNYALESGATRADYGQLRIDIAAPSAGAAPVAVAGADQSHTIHTTAPAAVALDGTASADSDGTLVSHTWVDMMGVPVAEGAAPTLALPEGDYYFTLVVEDNDGNIARDEVRVQVLFEWDPALYDPWPGRNPADPNQLVNLYGQSISRPVVTDLVWPAAAGEADVCLYADDKFAAVSLTVDDNTVPNHDWWIEQCDLHGFNMVWFAIIGDHRLNSGNGYFGTWEVFQANIVDNGQEMQSHTMTHQSDDNTRPDAEIHWEYSYSRALIDANITGQRCLTLAYPSGNGRPDIAAEYYIGARGTVGGANRAAQHQLHVHQGRLPRLGFRHPDPG